MCSTAPRRGAGQQPAQDDDQGADQGPAAERQHEEHRDTGGHRGDPGPSDEDADGRGGAEQVDGHEQRGGQGDELRGRHEPGRLAGQESDPRERNADLQAVGRRGVALGPQVSDQGGRTG